MNAVIWARVSSREQREGYSIDAQLRANRDKAAREGIKVVREFVVAESAKRGAERVAFNEMYRWVRENAKRQGINLILAHKLDRVCRNMREASPRPPARGDKSGDSHRFCIVKSFAPRDLTLQRYILP
jgi:DNA invertase Pin-like site-specific DNA recombinase